MGGSYNCDTLSDTSTGTPLRRYRQNQSFCPSSGFLSRLSLTIVIEVGAKIKTLSPELLLLLWTFHIQSSIQIECYNWDGSRWPSNFQCPGSQSCCGDPEECTQNRLCAQGNVLIRGPCLNAQFDDCSPLCHYNKSMWFYRSLVMGNTYNLSRQ